MKKIIRLMKYEFLNIIRSRWVFFYTLFLFLLSATFLYVSGTPSKALVTISSVITVLVPLTCILFTSFYWYNSDRLTELLLTQPLGRAEVLISRFIAMSLSLGIGFVVGVLLPFLFRGEWGLGIWTLAVFGGFLAVVFCSLGILIGVFVSDKMRGVGLAFGVWFYFVLVHDLLVLLVLMAAKDYPMDIWGSLLAAINPIGLTRVILLVQQEASMLLGHSGALIREILSTAKGILYALIIAGVWVSLPLYLSVRAFLRRDL